MLKFRFRVNCIFAIVLPEILHITQYVRDMFVNLGLELGLGLISGHQGRSLVCFVFSARRFFHPLNFFIEIFNVFFLSNHELGDRNT
jgi:hypothetical protein